MSFSNSAPGSAKAKPRTPVVHTVMAGWSACSTLHNNLPVQMSWILEILEDVLEE